MSNLLLRGRHKRRPKFDPSEYWSLALKSMQVIPYPLRSKLIMLTLDGKDTSIVILWSTVSVHELASHTIHVHTAGGTINVIDLYTWRWER